MLEKNLLMSENPASSQLGISVSRQLSLSISLILSWLSFFCNISLIIVMDVDQIEMTLSMLSVIFLCSSITNLSLSFLSASSPPSCNINISSPTPFN